MLYFVYYTQFVKLYFITVLSYFHTHVHVYSDCSKVLNTTNLIKMPWQTVKILNRHWQTVKTQIRLLLKEQSGQGLHCLLLISIL